jgi:hypothetical protein
MKTQIMNRTRKALLFFTLTAASVCANVRSTAAETQINGDFWFAQDGTKLDATEMSITKVGSYYYAFGCKRVLPTPFYDEIFREFRCYRSNDLRNWEFRGTSLTAAGIGLGDSYSGRCKVIYNAATAKYVMWFKLKDSSNDRSMGVATSNTIDGQYTFLGKRYGTGGQSGDMTLFQEGTTAYVAYSDFDTRDIYIERLKSDYLTVDARVKIIAGNLEAPNLFKVGGRYFCVGSGVTGWESNQSKYASSTSLSGTWTALANFGNGTTYDSQGSDVLVIQGSSATTAIFIADRWETPYLGSTTCLWLPITISGSTASITYRDSFVINPSTGVWSAAPAKYYRIINRSTGKALAIVSSDGSGKPLNALNNNADIVQWTYNSAQDWHKWRVEGTPDGYKRIINKYSGKAMAIFGARLDGFTPFAATDNNADICQFDYFDTDAFKWKADELGNGNGYRRIISKLSSKAVTVFPADSGGNPVSQTADGADVGQYTFNGTQNWYQWQFIPVP